ncbi:MAG: LPS export ABC transporter periplasmic protein LptC [Synergistes sp.]|nr:LPS export ABC transporter periplasmic protein LptC [Synergistes sp.]
MSSSKLPKKTLCLLAVIIAAAAGGYYLWRDLHLSAIENIKVPDIVVENIELERVIEGKKWKLISPRVEHKNNMLYGDSMDVTISDPAGKFTQMYADKGVFSRHSNDVLLTNAEGTMKEDAKDRVYDLKSGRAKYDSSAEKWYFKNGVTFALTENNTVIRGKSGYYDSKNGVCRLTERGTVTWSTFTDTEKP